jgi:hypothetical protein
MHIMNIGDTALQQIGGKLIAGASGSASAGILPVSSAQLESLIMQFNTIYSKPATRALYGQLETIYKNIIKNYTFPVLSTARRMALELKVLAYAQQLRNIESGKPAHPTDILNPITGELIQLPGIESTTGVAIPAPGKEIQSTTLFTIPIGNGIEVTQKTAIQVGLVASALGILSYLSGGKGGKRK